MEVSEKCPATFINSYESTGFTTNVKLVQNTINLNKPETLLSIVSLATIQAGIELLLDYEKKYFDDSEEIIVDEPSPDLVPELSPTNSVKKLTKGAAKGVSYILFLEARMVLRKKIFLILSLL